MALRARIVSCAALLLTLLLLTLLGGCAVQFVITLDPDQLDLAIDEQVAIQAIVSGAYGDVVLLWQASGGQVLGSGDAVTYQAPNEAGDYTLTALWADDPTRSASAAVVVRPIVTITPEQLVVESGAQATLTATVLGSGSGVTWQSSAGQLVASGNSATWTAPSATGSFTVTATSVADATVSATATLTVVPVGTGPDLAPLEPPTLALTADVGSQAGADVTLRNLGDADLTFAIASSETWLVVDVSGGTLAGSTATTVTVTGTCATVGILSGYLTVTSNDASDGIRTLPVTLTCSAHLSLPNPSQVSLAAEVLQPDAGSFSFDNLGGEAVDFTITGAPGWLGVAPTGGALTAGASQTVALSTTCGASASDDEATLTISSDVAGDSARTVAVSRSCSSPPPPPAPGYQLEVRYVTAMTASQQAAFDDAAARWSEIIVGDLPDTPLTLANACGSGVDIDETIDDLVIFARVEPIDGSGGILGSAGPCYLRSGGGLTLVGSMRFDSADVANLEASGSFEDVILHEMGHVIGVGTLWEWGSFDLLDYSGASCQASSDPSFNGAGAVGAYAAIGGSGNVPVEDGGSSGTKCGHWDEETFDNELMTGYLDGGAANPISRITAASLDDLGYQVDENAADSYDLPACSGSCLRAAPGPAVHAEPFLPLGEVAPNGTVTPFDNP